MDTKENGRGCTGGPLSNPEGDRAVEAVAVDVGGTFTDLIGVADGGIVALKVPSNPGAPDESVLAGLEQAGAQGARLVHGSTVATNAVLERKGARTAFVTTEGFADIIEIGRQERPSLYDLFVRKPPPLVERRMRVEAGERVGPGGRVIRKLSRSEARRVARRCAELRVESAAVCLLFSFEYPDHEMLLCEELSRAGIRASRSSFVLPEYREYERASTTVINAFIAPVVEGHLERLGSALGPTGASMRLMHSAGGTISARAAGSRAVDLVLSGPAGGAVASRWLAALTGSGDCIGFDMGGTSTDVTLVAGEELSITRATKIGGLPAAVPMIDIETIGAGGGSIAYVDAAGVLKVGPRSAGSDPGPACYGRSSLATVTDANVVLGRVEPSWFLGGRMKIFPARSKQAMASISPSGKAARAAAATLEVTLSNMEGAVKRVSVERGHDPRDFTLIAFGGAGPMHSCELAARLEIPRVLVPSYPGLFSSIGMLLAEPGRDYSRTILSGLTGAVSRIADMFKELEGQASGDMSEEGFPIASLKMARSLGMRYQGQSHEIEVPVTRITNVSIVKHFEDVYRTANGYLRDASEIEVVNVRVSCRARQAELPLISPPPAGRAEPLNSRWIYFGGKRMRSEVYARREIGGGQAVCGPALLVQDDTTTVLPPGWRAACDMMGNLVLEAVR